MEFKNLVNLDRLLLTGTDITDKTIAAICSLPKLRVLTLGSTDVTDECIDDLSKMTTLRDLNVVRTLITKPGAKRLQKQMPDCEVVYSAR